MLRPKNWVKVKASKRKQRTPTPEGLIKFKENTQRIKKIYEAKEMTSQRAIPAIMEAETLLGNPDIDSIALFKKMVVEGKDCSTTFDNNDKK